MPGGHWEAVCGRCLKVSPSVLAASDDAAWPELEGLGWSAYQHSPGSRRYAVCPKCSKESPGQVPRRKARRHR
jgi:hypothetical protein